MLDYTVATACYTRPEINVMYVRSTQVFPELSTLVFPVCDEPSINPPLVVSALAYSANFNPSNALAAVSLLLSAVAFVYGPKMNT